MASFKDMGRNVIVVEIKRALDTGDENDYVLPTDEWFDLSWAINTKSSDLSGKHDKRGSVRASIATGSKKSDQG